MEWCLHKLNGVPKNKVCLRVFENGCLQVWKEETGREQFYSSQSYEFGHTLLCNLSPTWMFNMSPFVLPLKHKTSLKNLPRTNTPAYFAAALLFPWECTCAAERWVCIFASIKKLANFGKITSYNIFSIRESVWQTDFGQHWICLMWNLVFSPKCRSTIKAIYKKVYSSKTQSSNC